MLTARKAKKNALTYEYERSNIWGVLKVVEEASKLGKYSTNVLSCELDKFTQKKLKNLGYKIKWKFIDNNGSEMKLGVVSW